MKKRVFGIILLVFGGVLSAQSDLGLTSEDLNVERREDGYHVYVRKKSGVNSVMFLETSRDPEGKRDNYAYRATGYNTVNGDEIRYLNGKVLDSKYSRYSLISSTAVKRDGLGECFHILVPETLVYGYPWSRNGTVTVGKGTFINIRTFEKPYGDYDGAFKDNPFMFDFAPVKEEKIILTDDYDAGAAESFNQIADKGNGVLRYSRPENLKDDLLSSLEEINPKTKVDVVFAIDTTGSMSDDLEALRKEWVPALIEQLKEFEDIRLGLLFYRDYTDDYRFNGLPVKLYGFTYSMDEFTDNLGSVRIRGTEGGDVPEAVYEALYSGMEYFEWREEAVKKIILIGDAEPHQKPRGTKKIDQDTVISLSGQKEITLDCIIVPDDKSRKK